MHCLCVQLNYLAGLLLLTRHTANSTIAILAHGAIDACAQCCLLRIAVRHDIHAPRKSNMRWT